MNFEELRNPWKLFGKRVFGFYLPFIGFEDVSVPRQDFIEQMGEDPGVDPVIGTMFTVEWFDRGFSFGAFKVQEKQ